MCEVEREKSASQQQSSRKCRLIVQKPKYRSLTYNLTVANIRIIINCFFCHNALFVPTTTTSSRSLSFPGVNRERWPKIHELYLKKHITILVFVITFKMVCEMSVNAKYVGEYTMMEQRCKGPSTRTLSHPILCPICMQIGSQYDSLSDFPSDTNHHLSGSYPLNVDELIFSGSSKFPETHSTHATGNRMANQTENRMQQNCASRRIRKENDP
jgi:hypothetical protein